MKYWTDYRLHWNASEYNGTTEIVTKANRIWLPDITLYNKLVRLNLIFIIILMQWGFLSSSS